MKRHFLNIIFAFFALSSLAQTVISGRVTDGVTGEPLPYVTISGNNVKLGTVSDFDGLFKIETSLAIDSLVATFMGYQKVKKEVILGAKQTIDFVLFESASSLNEIIVRPGGVNPAEVIMKRAQKMKKEYNPEKIEFYEYDGYNKVQLAVDNVSDKLKKRKLFEAMEPLFDTISSFSDSSALKVLPVFVSESLSTYYFRKFPRRTKEVIKATKIQGVGVGEESYVSQILGSTFQQYNFYENNLYILDKDFISPLSGLANAYYYFMLMDSIEVDGKSCYQIKVDPKNPKDLTFSGMIWITTDGYALKQLSLEITKEANLNFIEKLKIQQEFEEVEPTYWLPKKTRVLIDVAELTKNTAGMIGIYYNSSKNIKVNVVHELPFYEEKVTVAKEAFKMDDVFWDTARHEQITDEDKRIYEMVDSLKNQPLLSTYVDVIEMVVDGHIPLGEKIELGAYYYLLGYNPLEGIRTRWGFRTTPDFNKDFMVQAYGAYGFKDERFKYGVFADYVLSRTKWGKIGAFVKEDVELIGLTDEDVGTNALFDALSTFGTNQLNRSTTRRVWAEKELVKGYTQKINLTHKSYFFEPVNDFNFAYYNLSNDTGSVLSNHYDIASVNLRGRISHKEQFIYRKNQRYSLGNLKAPVFTFDYTHSFRDVLGGDFNFNKLGVEIWQFNSLANLGTFQYTFKAYKTFGVAPFPSLFVMRGNQSFVSSSSAYNLMNFFEFAADQYISFDYEHQFNGLFMNRIPLANKFKLREFVNTKMVYGTMSEGNKAIMPLNNPLFTTPSFFDRGKPYIEVGYGIENIFRFIRIDFIHRLTYLDGNHPAARPFGVKVNAVFRF